MRIVDPQSALLTNIEVYDFLKHHKPRKQDPKIGAYEPIDLKGYKEIRQDVLTYGERTTPQLTAAPSPDQYMNTVVSRLRKYDLTKTEIYMIINLALGLPRLQSATTNGDTGTTDNGENHEATDGDAGIDAEVESEAQPQIPGDVPDDEAYQANGDVDSASGTEVLGLIIDGLDERFPEETREQRLTEILAILRDSINSPATTTGVSNSTA